MPGFIVRRVEFLFYRIEKPYTVVFSIINDVFVWLSRSFDNITVAPFRSQPFLVGGKDRIKM